MIDTSDLSTWYADCQAGTLVNEDLPPELRCVSLGITADTDNPCEDYLTEIAQTNILVMQKSSYADALFALERGYRKVCWEVEEYLKVSYELDEYHYTLYYYDQAGTLVQTVPPEGVDLLSLTAQEVAEIEAWREGVAPVSTDSLEPRHRLITRYNYDSFGKVVETINPDVDQSSMFYYDKLGRERFSQNARQVVQSTPTWSYTKYDALSRAIEVGELSPNAGNNPLDPTNLEDATGYPAFSDGTLKEVTMTFYSENQPNYQGQTALPTSISFPQDAINTRNRQPSGSGDANGTQQCHARDYPCHALCL